MRSSNRLTVSRPLALAGFLVAATAFAISPADLATRLKNNERLLVVDVRPAAAYAESHIPGAINIPLSLLPHKQIPSAQLVVVYGDGLGLVDESQALTALRSRPGLTADVLEGGFAAWLAETRLSTGLPGVTREKLPGITYQQLVAANKGDMVLVDLRRPATAAAPAASAKTGRPATAAATRDLIAEFGGKLGVPVVASADALPTNARSQSPATAAAGAPARAAAPTVPGGPNARLLVLVADDEAAANEAARQLRASGHYRFTVLIGGTEIIRHEGRQGTGRMDGDLPGAPVKP